MKARTGKIRYRVYYDEYCPFCRSAKNVLSRTDYLHILGFEGISSYSSTHGISAEMMMRGGIQVVRPGGKISGKNRAIIVLTFSNPIFFPLAVISSLLEVLRIGDRVYDFVASRRYAISKKLPFSH